MELIDAIYKRRSIRDFTPQAVEKATVEELLKAAVQAPSAMNRQPWAFMVIQDRTLLHRISDESKSLLLRTMPVDGPLTQYRAMLEDSSNDIFHHAGTLVLICATIPAPSAAEDCCFAAQNLLLTACAAGLGTCPIGFARDYLNLASTKTSLGIPLDYQVVIPVVVGYPAGLSRQFRVARRRSSAGTSKGKQDIDEYSHPPRSRRRGGNRPCRRCDSRGSSSRATCDGSDRRICLAGAGRRMAA